MQKNTEEVNDIKSPKRQLNTQQSLIKRQELFCRICLEELQTTEIPDLCLCKGENGIIHQKCMLEWMRRADKYVESSNRYYYHCDICRTKIYLNNQTKYNRQNWEEIHFFNHNTCYTITTIILSLISLAAIIISLYLYNRSDLKPLNIFGMFAGVITLVLDVCIYVFQVAFETQLIIHGIEKAQIKKNKKNQVVPMITQTKNNKHQVTIQNVHQSSQFTLNQFVR